MKQKIMITSIIVGLALSFNGCALQKKMQMMKLRSDTDKRGWGPGVKNGYTPKAIESQYKVGRAYCFGEYGEEVNIDKGLEYLNWAKGNGHVKAAKAIQKCKKK